MNSPISEKLACNCEIFKNAVIKFQQLEIQLPADMNELRLPFLFINHILTASFFNLSS